MHTRKLHKIKIPMPFIIFTFFFFIPLQNTAVRDLGNKSRFHRQFDCGRHAIN